MVAYAIQFRRGTTAESNSFTGLEGEIVLDTEKKTLVVHDGSTVGGKAVATFDDLITDVSQLQDSTGVLGTLLSEIHNGTPVEPTVQVSGTAGSGLGASSASPASDISALRAAGITTDGMYWFNNSISNSPFQAYCKFNYVDGNDWYLLLKVHNQGDMTSGNPLWTNDTLHNETDDDLTSGNFSKYATWNNIKFKHLMMEMHQDGTAKYPPIMSFTTERTFAEAITTAGGVTAASNQNNIVAADSTVPSYTSNVVYHDTVFEYNGNTFTNTGLFERYVQKYGISMWSNNSTNSTTAEGYASTGRAGAWIGCPLDNNGHTFGNNSNTGSDSGFGFGTSGGNTPKTTSAGYSEWNGTASTNTLPGYVWVRPDVTGVTSTSVASFSGTWDDGYSLRNSSYNIGATYDANTYKWSLNGGGDTFAGVVPNANFLAAVSPGNNEGVWFKVKFEDMNGGIMSRKLGGWAFTATDTYASEGSADMLSSTELRGDGNSVNNSASDEGGSYGWSTKFNPGAKSSWWSALYFNPTTGYSAHYISHDDTNWSLWADKTFQNPSSVQGIWATVWRRTPGDTASVTLVDVDATVLGLI